MNIAMIVLIFVIFYFFMIRPQQRKQKELQKKREALGTNDRIVTSGGLYGVIKDIKETGRSYHVRAALGAYRARRAAPLFVP